MHLLTFDAFKIFITTNWMFF